MAKRKRLTPPRPDFIGGTTPAPAGLPGTSPPISHIAGDAAAIGALREVAEEMSAARADGRFVMRLPLDQVDETWLVRDRIGSDTDALASLKASLRSHGQRSPIEVADLGQGHFGLISGWRRLTALRALHEETGQDKFTTVLALPRKPEMAEDAYVAMVEENEIRLGLSYFERARIAAKAVEAGVFKDEKRALQTLYASASRAKRSKIGSFLRIYHALGNDLRFASALPERLGLAVVKALDADPRLAGRMARQLAANPATSAAQEQAFLQRMATPKAEKQNLKREKFDNGVVLETHQTATETQAGKVVLHGKGLTPDMLEHLRVWLATR